MYPTMSPFPLYLYISLLISFCFLFFTGRASIPGLSQKCATQLCECDREFARCVSNYPCPRKKPGCSTSNYILLPTITKNEI